jgi:hypothetical protein
MRFLGRKRQKKKKAQIKAIDGRIVSAMASSQLIEPKEAIQLPT